MHTVILSLGSNIGRRNRYLQAGRSSLVERLGTEVAYSSCYESAAWGLENQADFLNTILIINTVLQPVEILAIAQDIEKKMDRKRLIRWGPRTLDIDILFYDNIILQSADLIIPHPRIQDRKFVLEPLNELVPNWIHPSLKVNVSQLLASCKDQAWVKKISGFTD